MACNAAYFVRAFLQAYSGKAKLFNIEGEALTMNKWHTNAVLAWLLFAF
jgi:hypothetical protein